MIDAINNNISTLTRSKKKLDKKNYLQIQIDLRKRMTANRNKKTKDNRINTEIKFDRQTATTEFNGLCMQNRLFMRQFNIFLGIYNSVT